MIRAVVGLIVMITGGYLVARYYPSRLAIYVAAVTVVPRTYFCESAECLPHWRAG